MSSSHHDSTQKSTSSPHPQTSSSNQTSTSHGHTSSTSHGHSSSHTSSQNHASRQPNWGTEKVEFHVGKAKDVYYIHKKALDDSLDNFRPDTHHAVKLAETKPAVFKLFKAWVYGETEVFTISKPPQSKAQVDEIDKTIHNAILLYEFAEKIKQNNLKDDIISHLFLLYVKSGPKLEEIELSYQISKAGSKLRQFMCYGFVVRLVNGSLEQRKNKKGVNKNNDSKGGSGNLGVHRLLTSSKLPELPKEMEAGPEVYKRMCKEYPELYDDIWAELFSFMLGQCRGRLPCEWHEHPRNEWRSCWATRQWYKSVLGYEPGEKNAKKHGKSSQHQSSSSFRSSPRSDPEKHSSHKTATTRGTSRGTSRGMSHESSSHTTPGSIMCSNLDAAKDSSSHGHPQSHGRGSKA